MVYIDLYNNTLLSNSLLQEITYNDFNLDPASIDRDHEIVVRCLVDGANATLPKRRPVSYLKPYWNDPLKHCHSEMSKLREEWCRQGRPRGHEWSAYTEYKNAKREFRRTHRRRVAEHMAEENAEVDRTAEVDPVTFWKNTNRRRKPSRSSANSGIKFNGTLVRDKVRITHGWHGYFKEMYANIDDNDYDNVFKTEISQRLHDTLPNLVPDQSAVVTPELISEIIGSFPKGKAAGHDNVTYEHYKYAKSVVSPALANIYTRMLRSTHAVSSVV